MPPLKATEAKSEEVEGDLQKMKGALAGKLKSKKKKSEKPLSSETLVKERPSTDTPPHPPPGEFASLHAA